MKSRYTVILLLLTSLLQAGTSSSEGLQGKLLVNYFAQQLGISVQDVELDIIHAPDIDNKLFHAGQISVQGGSQSLNLGHQTLWLVLKTGQVVKKRWPITIDVHANLQLPISVESIPRQDLLTADKIVFEKRRVGREYQRALVRENEILGKMASQTIPAGRIIERNMLKNAPDVLRGAALQIVLMDKGLALELPGIAKEEGLIGEEIRVQCPTTRKEFRGILQNPQAVIVSLR